MHLAPPIIGGPVCSLIFRKISKIGATRCQINVKTFLTLKSTKFTFHWASNSDLQGNLQRSPRPLPVFKGPTFKGRGRKGKGEKGREGGGRGLAHPKILAWCPVRPRIMNS